MEFKGTMRQYGSRAILMIGSEIIMKLKVYVVLQYTRKIADVTRAQLGRLQKCTEGWSNENKCINVVMKHLLSGKGYELIRAKVFDMQTE